MKESLVLWKQTSVIDVYNMKENSYQFSFYVDDIEGKKLKTFQVLNDKFIGLVGNHIVIYQLGDRFKKVETATVTVLNSNPKSQVAKSKTKDQKT